MEIASLKVTLKQLRDAIAVAYSLVVMATIIPGFGHVSIVIPYYVFVPGYYTALLLRSTSTIVETFLYSVAWSLAILTSVYSVMTLAPGFQGIQISIVVPALTLVLLASVRYRR